MITLTFGEVQESPIDIALKEAEESGWLGCLSVADISDRVFGCDQQERAEPPSIYTRDDLTYEGYQNLSTCHKEFKKFIQRVNYRYSGFKYAAVFARQKNTGNWHYHVISNLYIDKEELRELWGLGATHIKAITTANALAVKAKYCVKNLFQSSNELKSEKGYLASKGLNKPREYRSWNQSEKPELERYSATLKEARQKGVRYEKQETSHLVKLRRCDNCQYNFFGCQYPGICEKKENIECQCRSYT